MPDYQVPVTDEHDITISTHSLPQVSDVSIDFEVFGAEQVPEAMVALGMTAEHLRGAFATRPVKVMLNGEEVADGSLWLWGRHDALDRMGRLVGVSEPESVSEVSDAGR